QREGAGASAEGAGEGASGRGAEGKPDAQDRQGAPDNGAGDGGDGGLGGAEPGQVGIGPSGGPQQRVLAGPVAGRGVVDVRREREAEDGAGGGGGIVRAVDLHDDGLAAQG